MSHISTLKLQDFRCYAQASLRDLSRGLIVLHGPNGAGKTNILEALSLLSPGKGLRGAPPSEIQRHQGAMPWALFTQIETPYGPVEIGTGFDPATEKRTIRINSETAKTQTALSEHVSCVWLTPQMDRLFLEAPAHRRKFLDRLIFAFDPAHAGRITRYDNAMRQRSRLLQEGSPETGWIAGLEIQMAQTGIAISAARTAFLTRLQTACDSTPFQDLFPLARLHAIGTIEELLQQAPALEVEDLFQYQLAQSRTRDALTGGATTGPHKSDFGVHYAAKNMPAEHCSTGEQKALLIGLVLAHSRLILTERGVPPLLLLDEISAHLDAHRRTVLYDQLLALGGQVWLTGTDALLFESLETRAQFFHVQNNRISE